MTYEEANELKDINSEMIYGTNTTAGYLNSWLGSARNASRVWSVFGFSSSLSGLDFSTTSRCGVRPVVEISKDLIK